MEPRKIPVTRAQVLRLMEDLAAIPNSPVGDHLSDQEFTGYALELLPDGEVERLDRHLASCAECANEMERLTTAAAAWSGEEGSRRLAALRERTLQPRHAEEVVVLPRFAWQRSAAAARTDREPWTYKESGLLKLEWGCRED